MPEVMAWIAAYYLPRNQFCQTVMVKGVTSLAEKIGVSANTKLHSSSSFVESFGLCITTVTLLCEERWQYS